MLIRKKTRILLCFATACLLPAYLQGSQQGESGASPAMNDSITELPSIKQSIEKLVGQLSTELVSEGISEIGVSRFYINGSSVDGRSSAYLYQILKTLLRGGDFDVFDRSTLSVVMAENELQYLVSGESDTSLQTGEVIVVGDLLYAKNCSEAFLAIRAIETKDSRVVFARTARALVSADEMQELGMKYRDITSENLPEVDTQSKQDLSQALDRAKSKATGFSLVFDSPQSEDQSLWGRIGYLKALEIAASLELALFDRDLLLTLFEEAGIGSTADQALSFGDALISVKPEEKSVGVDGGALSVKIYKRENSALLALAELNISDVTDGRIEKPWDDSLAAALQHMRNRTELNANELKFESTFKLDRYNAKSEALAIMQVVDNNFNWGQWSAEITKPGKESVIEYRRIFPDKYDRALTRESLVMKFGDVAKRLVVKEDNDEGDIRRKFISMIIVGVNQYSEGMYSGLWEDISCRMRNKLTTSPEGKALKRELLDKLRPFVENWAENNESPYEGNFTDEDISFNYSIDYRFKGIYPEWVTLQIDLTPMKDRLYKVIKDENKYN